MPQSEHTLTAIHKPNIPALVLPFLVMGGILVGTAQLSAAAGDRFPYSFGTNWTTTHDGLHLSAVVDKTTYGTTERPSVTVTFSNESSIVVVLLNHFALTAVGPLFRPLIRYPEDPKQYREVSFAEQISMRKTRPPWILLKPGEVHCFQSPLYDPLPAGHHSLQVQYSVAGPAESMIAECRKEPSCPADFWHGDLLSNVVNIEVKSESSSATAETLVGGYSEVSTTNAEVIAAAKFAVNAVAIPKHDAGMRLDEILSAQQQVVAGMNYRLRLKVKVDGTVKEAEAVVWRKLSGKHQLTSWTWKEVVQMQVHPVQFKPKDVQREVYIGADTNAIRTVDELQARIKGLPVGTEFRWYSGCYHYEVVPVGTNQIPMKEFVTMCEKTGVTFSYSCGF